MKKLYRVLTAVVLCAFLSGCGTANSIVRDIQKGDYQHANEVYHGKVSGNTADEQEVLSEMLALVADTRNKLNSGKMSISEVEVFLDTLRSLDFGVEILFSDELSSLAQLMMSRKSYESGMTCMQNGDFADAYQYFDEVIEEDQKFSSAQEKKAEAENKGLESLKADVDELLKINDFASAYDLVKSYAVFWGESESLAGIEAGILEKWVDNDISVAEQLLLQEKYSKAMEALTACCSQTGYEDDSVEAEKQRIESAWTAAALSAAEEAFGENRDYDAAIKALQASGLGNDAVNAEIARYQSYAPVMLSSMEPTQKTTYIRFGARDEEDAKDVNNEVYNRADIIHPTGGSLNSETAKSEDDAYISFYLNMEFESFSAVLYRPYSSLHSTDTWEKETVVKIYGDGALLYEAPSFTQDTYDVYDIDLNVSGVRELKIVMMGVWTAETDWIGIYDRNPKVCMANMQLLR